MPWTPEEEKALDEATRKIVIEEVMYELVPLLIQVIYKCLPILHEYLDPRTIQHIKKLAEKERYQRFLEKYYKEESVEKE